MVEEEKEKVRAARWSKPTLQVIGAVLVVGMLYFLSFGPVLRFCCTITTTMAPPAAISGSGTTAVSTTTIKMPMWVRTIYSPVISVAYESPGESGMLQAYRSYLDWWQRG
jgi:hypothetical protein